MGDDGVVRSLNGADKSAAEDRFCWPPPTPSCTQYQVECNSACAALTPTYDPSRSCRITARRCIFECTRDCNCSLFGSTTTTTTPTPPATTATTAAPPPPGRK